MILAAFISFFAFFMLTKHLSDQTMRRAMGYVGVIDVALHGSIFLMFFHTFEGLMQAEAAGILFSSYLRWYRWAWGFERYTWWTDGDKRRLCWVRTVGHLTKVRRVSA